MKFLGLVLSLSLSLSLVSTSALAASNAVSKDYSYCDDPAKIQSLLDRSFETTERLQGEGVKIERIVVLKETREMFLIQGDAILRKYNVALGSNSVGHKQFEGDRKTPEGIYVIDGKNPNSKFTKSLHISYPNKTDLEFAKSQGQSAGGEIMIHGFPTGNPTNMTPTHYFRNWTWGCIAVTSEEIEEIYSLVKVKTLIEVCPKTSAEALRHRLPYRLPYQLPNQ